MESTNTGTRPGPTPTGDLSPAATDVRDALEKFARMYPQLSGPRLVLMLAQCYCPARLKRRHRNAR
jgi:hypothetical protein